MVSHKPAPIQLPDQHLGQWRHGLSQRQAAAPWKSRHSFPVQPIGLPSHPSSTNPHLRYKAWATSLGPSLPTPAGEYERIPCGRDRGIAATVHPIPAHAPGTPSPITTRAQWRLRARPPTKERGKPLHLPCQIQQPHGLAWWGPRPWPRAACAAPRCRGALSPASYSVKRVSVQLPEEAVQHRRILHLPYESSPTSLPGGSADHDQKKRLLRESFYQSHLANATPSARSGFRWQAQGEQPLPPVHGVQAERMSTGCTSSSTKPRLTSQARSRARVWGLQET